MQTDDLLRQFRFDVADTVEPYLWKDEEVYTYLDDAQKMFCRLTDGIADATTVAVVDITVSVNDEFKDLHDSILKIRGATRTSDGRELSVINYEDMAGLGLRFDGSTGPIERLIVGMEEGKVRVSPKASVADAIKLLVFRLPINTLSETVQDLEIPAQHHLHLLLWAKKLAYSKQDAETLDKRKAQDFELQFRNYCAAVRVEQQKKRHKVRVVAYGGI